MYLASYHSQPDILKSDHSSKITILFQKDYISSYGSQI